MGDHTLLNLQSLDLTSGLVIAYGHFILPQGSVWAVLDCGHCSANFYYQIVACRFKTA